MEERGVSLAWNRIYLPEGFHLLWCRSPGSTGHGGLALAFPLPSSAFLGAALMVVSPLNLCAC